MNVQRLKFKGSQELNVQRFKVKGLEDNIQPSNLQSATQAHLQPGTPWIWIRTEVVEEDWVAIRIADKGIGITQELSFYTLDHCQCQYEVELTLKRKDCSISCNLCCNSSR